MKNENKVTIKNKKIMIHKFSRYLLTLVALLAMTTGAWAAGETYTVKFEANGKSVVKKNVTLPATYTFNLNGNGNFDQIIKELYSDKGGTGYDFNNTPKFSVSNAAVSRSLISGTYEVVFTISKAYEGKVTIYGVYGMSGGGSFNFTIDMSCYDPSTPVISTDQTEAEFEMPSYDATLEYDIVRNLASNTTLNLFIGTDAVTADARLRIKKDGSAYIPVSALSFTLTDAPEGGQTTTLTAAQALAAGLNPVYELKGEGEDQWTIVAINETTHLPATLAPGQTYRVSLVAADDAPLYGGEVQAQYLVTLFEGYEVTVPAGEYVTYYKDENLYVEDEEAQLYTITSVGTETATATELTVAKALTPILVKNNGQEKKVILLIPTATEGDEVDYAPEFVGTLEATTIAASSENQNNYAFNGLQFVWVKNAIEIGANKAWLSISNSNARAITLVFDDATAIEMVNGQSSMVNGTWYDLNGRKVNAPSKKGIYIMNGRKVVVK